jgi:hypothetical protein
MKNLSDILFRSLIRNHEVVWEIKFEDGPVENRHNIPC